jgi:hypothetical protein
MITFKNHKHRREKTVSHDKCEPDVGGSGFTVTHANHKAETSISTTEVITIYA